MKNQVATAFVEEIIPGRTKVRINVVNAEQSSSGYGMKGERETPIEDGSIYQDIFAKVQQAIFIRKNVT